MKQLAILIFVASFGSAFSQTASRAMGGLPIYDPSPLPRPAPEVPLGSFVLDKDYLMYGDASIAPVAVYSTGRRMYIQLEDWRSPPPSILAVTPLGYVPIRANIDPPFITFDGPENEIVLMQKQRFVVIRHAKAKPIMPTEERSQLFVETSSSRSMSSDAALGNARDRHSSLLAGEAALIQQQSMLQNREQAAKAEQAGGVAALKQQDTRIASLQSSNADLSKSVGELRARLDSEAVNTKSALVQITSQTSELQKLQAQSETFARTVQRDLGDFKTAAVTTQSSDKYVLQAQQAAVEATKRTLAELQNRIGLAQRNFDSAETRLSAAQKSIDFLSKTPSPAVSISETPAQKQQAIDLKETQIQLASLAAAAKRNQTSYDAALKELQTANEQLARARDVQTPSNTAVVEALGAKIATLEGSQAQLRVTTENLEFVRQAQQISLARIEQTREQLNETQKASSSNTALLSQRSAELKSAQQSLTEQAQTIESLRREQDTLKNNLTAPAAVAAPVAPKQAAPPAAAPQSWLLRADDRLLSVALRRWSLDSGLEFRNLLGMDFPVLTTETFTGSLPVALSEVSEQMRSAGANAEAAIDNTTSPPSLLLQKRTAQ
jgi:hypothetical protein